MPATIGFIGLGIMGAPMAQRLISAGYDVVVYNRTASRAEPLVAAGARAAAQPLEVAQQADLVLSIVTDSPDAEAVLLAEGGAVHGARKGALFVDMSTIAPQAARDIGTRLGQRGVRFVDAPVTGGDVGAKNGTLSILVGGAPEDLDRARPVLGHLGARITHCGPIGAGQTLKACNQILCALNMVGLTEAMALARAGGIDPALLPEALAAGAGGSWALEKLGPRIVAEDDAPGFMIDLIQKDLRIVQAMAEAAGLPLAGTAVAQSYFADNQAHGEGRRGTQGMFRALARRA